MPFSGTFPLQVNIWHYTGTTAPQTLPPDVVAAPCYWPRNLSSFPFQGTQPLTFYLYMPKGTDVRGANSAGGIGQGDSLELPAGSGCYYQCFQVFDVEKGTPAEYRACLMWQIYTPAGVQP